MSVRAPAGSNDRVLNGLHLKIDEVARVYGFNLPSSACPALHWRQSDPSVAGEAPAALSGPREIDSGILQTVLPRWFIAESDIEILGKIDEGGFGLIHHGKWFGADVIIKIAKLDDIDKDKEAALAAFCREADVWFSLSHENVIRLFGAHHLGSRPFFVCEAARQSLSKAVYGPAVPNDDELKQRWNYLWDAGQGLQYLHQQDIVHGDLKANNILIGASGKAQLADFGLSAVVSRGSDSADGGLAASGAMGAYRWKAPEHIAGAPVSISSDLFSFGMTILEVVSGNYPWSNLKPEDAVKHNVTNGQLPSKPSGFPDEGWRLVEGLCCLHPAERLPMSAVVYVLGGLWGNVKGATSLGKGWYRFIDLAIEEEEANHREEADEAKGQD